MQRSEMRTAWASGPVKDFSMTGRNLEVRWDGEDIPGDVEK